MNGYAVLIEKIRAFEADHDTETAIDMAITYCIQNDLLKVFLEAHRAEVKEMIMLSTTFEEAMEMFRRDAQKEKETAQEESRAQGIEQGEEQFAQLAQRLLSEGKSAELLEISKNTEKRKAYYRLYDIV